VFLTWGALGYEATGSNAYTYVWGTTADTSSTSHKLEAIWED
jgi:hypothetical protein